MSDTIKHITDDNFFFQVDSAQVHCVCNTIQLSENVIFAFPRFARYRYHATSSYLRWRSKSVFWLPTLSLTFLPKMSKSILSCTASQMWGKRTTLTVTIKCFWTTFPRYRNWTTLFSFDNAGKIKTLLLQSVIWSDMWMWPIEWPMASSDPQLFKVFHLLRAFSNGIFFCTFVQ